MQVATDSWLWRWDDCHSCQPCLLTSAIPDVQPLAFVALPIYHNIITMVPKYDSNHILTAHLASMDLYLFCQKNLGKNLM
jgi:hypothetical protein